MSKIFKKILIYKIQKILFKSDGMYINEIFQRQKSYGQVTSTERLTVAILPDASAHETTDTTQNIFHEGFLQ